MKNVLISAILLCVSIAVSAQKSYSDIEIQLKLDSINKEADHLYKYARIASILLEKARADGKINADYSAYLVYKSDRGFRAIAVSNRYECIYELVFPDEHSFSAAVNAGTRDLTDQERDLYTARGRIMSNIIARNDLYKVDRYKGYDMIHFMIPENNGYRFVIMTGSPKQGIIPYGNDHIFYTTRDGRINSWRKFHDGFYPSSPQLNERPPKSNIHKHGREEPFITATDICTFRIYGAPLGQKSFFVLSPALSKILEYDSEKDKIFIRDLAYLPE